MGIFDWLFGKKETPSETKKDCCSKKEVKEPKKKTTPKTKKKTNSKLNNRVEESELREVYGSVTKYLYKDKPFTGIGYYKHSNGKIKGEMEFKDGLVYGTFKSWYENGNIKEEKFRKKEDNGPLKFNGIQKEWYKNGNLEKEEVWEDWIKTSETNYDENGNVLGKEEGDKEYYGNNQLKSNEKQIKIQGKNQTLTEQWSENGKRTRVHIYETEKFEGHLYLSFDSSGNLIDDEEKVNPTRFQLLRIIGYLKNIEDDLEITRLSYCILSQYIDDDSIPLDEIEESDWVDGDREYILECSFNETGEIIEENDNFDPLDLERELDYHLLNKFPSILKKDIDKFGKKLEDFVTTNKIEQEIISYEESTKKEHQEKQKVRQNLREELIKYLKI